MATTPRELARELGISPTTLRAWLRRGYPRADGSRGRWYLSDEQVAGARLPVADFAIPYGPAPVAPGLTTPLRPTTPQTH